MEYRKLQAIAACQTPAAREKTGKVFVLISEPESFADSGRYVELSPESVAHHFQMCVPHINWEAKRFDFPVQPSRYQEGELDLADELEFGNNSGAVYLVHGLLRLGFVGNAHYEPSLAGGSHLVCDSTKEEPDLELLRALKTRRENEKRRTEEDIRLREAAERREREFARERANEELDIELRMAGFHPEKVELLGSAFPEMGVAFGEKRYRFSRSPEGRWTAAHRWSCGGSTPSEALKALLEQERETNEVIAELESAPRVALAIEGIGAVEVADLSAAEPVEVAENGMGLPFVMSAQGMSPFPTIRRYRRQRRGDQRPIVTTYFTWGRREGGRGGIVWGSFEERQAIRRAVAAQWGAAVEVDPSLQR